MVGLEENKGDRVRRKVHQMNANVQLHRSKMFWCAIAQYMIIAHSKVLYISGNLKEEV
jgi:hypothetical protein